MTQLIEAFQTIIVVGLLVIVHYQHRINKNQQEINQNLLDMVKNLNRVVLGVQE